MILSLIHAIAGTYLVLLALYVLAMDPSTD